ncbi:MAG TPA: hypothetical protein VLM85_19480 [Polyangiaceae bacterium]|nr:hypothetical protein [Polyangiaceae bacterium]
MRAAVLLFCVAASCDQPKTSAPSEAAAPPPTTTAAAATVTSKPRPPASANLPPRPIPKPQNTVGSGAPQDVQMKAIAYMTALAAAQPDDMPVDEPWVKNLVDQLGPIVRTMDRGNAEAKGRLDKVEIVAGGRRIDLLMASGCDAQLPARAAQNASAPLDVLLSHGVLVVRCNDSHYQCLQSTRDADDVLCTTAPRH